MDPAPNIVFVGQVPRDMGDHELRDVMEECGRVLHINMLTDRNTGQFKGCAFVTYESNDEAQRAKDTFHDKRRLPGANHAMQVTAARAKAGGAFGGGATPAASHGGVSESRPDTHQPRKKLFVGMLARTLGDEDLRQMFLPYGDVEDCVILRNSDKTSKGCAFVTLTDMNSCQKAIVALHNSQTFPGCSGPMVVKFADTQAQKEGRQRVRMDMHVPGPMHQPPPMHHPAAPAGHVPHLHPPPMSAAPAPAYSHHLGMPPQQPASQAVAPAGGPGPDLSSLQNLLAPTMAQLVKQQQELQQQQRNINQALQLLGIPSANGGGGGSGASDYPGAAADPSIYAQAGMSSSPAAGLGYDAPLAGGASHVAHSAAAAAAAAVSSGVGGPATSGPGGYRTGPDNSNLFIYHLASSATDNDLYQLFSAYGRVLSARVYCDRNTGQSKGFGFVSYDNQQSAEAAIGSLNGYQMGGRRLKVQLKKGREGARPY
eukprot:scpid41360/ scgid33348/ CUGBP Elav-like family member 3; Bruno-like protein 1; CUG-BP- and ETR-3-like factor 3; ELAV-type RNA-binding protein 1; RNA-binding protein BRUNOL-1; Trinucleotide repeat-containing gene 4 protein